MSHEFPNQGDTPKNLDWEILAQLNHVSEQTIADFRAKILPDYQEIFDDLPEEEQKIIIVIDQLDDSVIWEILKQKKPLVGLHHIPGYLQAAYSMTGNTRYEQFMNR
jgi:Cdc6-like AAA superfamily ATPase